eukprot:TRINITY_DN11749_c0_g1_i2.p2 TRINITY_DN11749_c0_g1~~TRINITY_DN11749_c0_g1_i2.p2  ORF type:complete len:160 (+),score=39.60 TRINITY_DN11749_c0_g1_i2:88-567(+)
MAAEGESDPKRAETQNGAAPGGTVRPEQVYLSESPADRAPYPGAEDRRPSTGGDGRALGDSTVADEARGRRGSAASGRSGGRRDSISERRGWKRGQSLTIETDEAKLRRIAAQQKQREEDERRKQSKQSAGSAAPAAGQPQLQSRPPQKKEGDCCCTVM